MGQEILYCYKCQNRIVGADFTKGAAYEVGNNVCCSKCAAELLNTLPPKDRESLIAQMFKATQERKSGSTNASLQALSAPMSSSSTRMKTPAPNPPSERRRSGDTARRLWSKQSKNSMTFAAVGVAALAVVGLVMLNSAGKQTPVDVPTKVTPPPTTDARTPAAEHEEVRKAREFARANPKDVDGQIAAWRAALLATDRTPGAELAQKELDRLLIVQREAVTNALQVIDVQIKPYMSSEEFVSVADILRAARGKFPSTEWTTAIDRKIDEARATAVALLPALKAKAAEAHRRKAEDEIKAIQTRVRKWGHPDLSRELDSVLADSPQPPPTDPNPPPVKPSVVSKELSDYLPRWELAMGRAAAGDPAGAIPELTSAVQALSEAAAKAEGNEDLEALRRAAAALQEIREALARTPKGQKVSVERWNYGGALERIEGTLLASEPGRLLLRNDAGIVPLELGEVSPGTIAELFAARSTKKPDDERTLALLTALGGDAERAAKLNAPDRWRVFAAKAVASATAGREADARRLFAEAEDAAGDPARIGTTIANYRTLLADHATTAFVARNRALLTGRQNLGKEYLYFPDSLKGSGSFSWVKGGKQDLAWVSEKDSEASAAPQNFVELSFTSLPDLDYKLWVYVGGCCLETFTFGVQGTDMVLPSSKTTPAEPGAAVAITIRPPLSLKKTHEQHTGPKSPTRWEWIPVPLPKYGAPGVKVVRLITDQKGFGVAYASVSALTSNSPRDSEIRELEKARGRKLLAVKDIPGLVAHWPLDEGSGATTAEATGKLPAATINGASWTTGRSGAALRFDGGDAFVLLPNVPTLRQITNGSCTISAWFQPEGVPTGAGDANDGAYGIVMRNGMHQGLHFNRGSLFVFGHWLGEDVATRVHAAAVSKSFPPGPFYHVAGGIDRPAGKAFLYVNGKLESTVPVDPAKKPWDFGDAQWRLGTGLPQAATWRWCAKGVIDDVRFYNRALTAAEVDALYRAAGQTSAAKAPAADARPWKPIFDGKTMSSINSACLNAWQLKDGSIVHVSGIDNAAQTNEDFGDGDLRLRLESRGNSVMWFIVRQSGANGYRLGLAEHLQGELNKGEHEVVFIMRGASVTATVDGKPARMDPIGAPPVRGVVQFNCTVDGGLRIQSIEFREAK